MEPNAVITISGSQQMLHGEPETVSLVTQGYYAYEPDRIVLQYAETEMTGQAGVVRCAEGVSMEMSRPVA